MENKYRMGDYLRSSNNKNLVVVQYISEICFDRKIFTDDRFRKWMDDRELSETDYKVDDNQISVKLKTFDKNKKLKTIEFEEGVKVTHLQNGKYQQEEVNMDKELVKKEKFIDRPQLIYSHTEVKGYEEKANDEFTIEGFASTGDVDRDSDIVEPEAFKNTVSEFAKNPILCYMHNWKDPIGVVTDAKIVKPGQELMYNKTIHKSPSGGLFIRANITKTRPELREMIKEGILKAFSIGFMIKNASFDDDLEVRRINDIELFEISVVSIPSNRSSLFSFAKALKNGTDIVSDNDSENVNTSIKLSEESENFRKRIFEASKNNTLCIKGMDVESAIESVKHFGKSQEVVGKDLKQTIKKHFQDVADYNKSDEQEVISETDISKMFVDQDNLKSVFRDEEKQKSARKDHVTEFLNIPSHKQKLLSESFSAYKIALTSKGIDEKIKEDKMSLEKVININYCGELDRPVYSYLETGRDKTEELLVEGYRFLKSKDDHKFVAQTYISWRGFFVVNVFYKKQSTDFMKEFMEELKNWMSENNFYRKEKITPSGQFLPIPDLDFDKVKLPEDSKTSIKVGALDFFSKKEMYKKNNIPFKRGIIFAGQPGTGKTLTGKVLMAKTDVTFIWVNSNETDNMPFLFRMARELSPSILFAEDIDDVFKWQHKIDSIKTEMDGMDSNDGIVTILCTNFPESIPDALIDRPSRFDDVIKFELPDESIRLDILKIHSESVDIENKDDALKRIAKDTDGLTGAHLKELIVYAMLLAFDDNREQVKMEDLTRSLEKINNTRELISDMRAKKQFVKDVRKKCVNKGVLKNEIASGKKIDKTIKKKSNKSMLKIPQDIMNDILELLIFDSADSDQLIKAMEYLVELSEGNSEKAAVKYLLGKLDDTLKQYQEVSMDQIEKKLLDIISSNK